MTNDYIEHCTQIYNTGLNIIAARVNNIQHSATWNIYNTYRRDMTIKVLDVIALFSNYNTHRYPATINNNTLLPKTELTRELYTNANNDEAPPFTSNILNIMEERFTRNSHLFTWLEQLYLYTRTYNTGVKSLTANSNCNMKTLVNRCENTRYGSLEANDVISLLNLPRNNIDKIVVTHNSNAPTVIIKMEFFQGANSVAVYNSGASLSNTETKTFEIPFTKVNNQTINHRFSYMKTYANLNNLPIYPNETARQIAFAWTHSSVDYNNTIQEKVITAIPAIKAQVTNNTTIIPNPGHIGGDLIQFNPGGIGASLLLQCRTSNFINNTPKNYSVRIRYISNKPITVNISISPGRGTSFVTSNTIGGSLPEGNYLYKQFSYADVFIRSSPITLNQNANITINIQSLSPLTQDTIFAIDRIEFIPLDHFQTFENEQQTIETIQNQTND
ncbi:insecticidal delta-endotoxin Cry8Ea1 family protein, partial [Bacillus mycoides]|uniref:insecticidal delta-endotoxin Cry8Ea1 family protein n=1 Tax=Bacillus mycoides TaxID=1405 RepID=UPI003A800D5C